MKKLLFLVVLLSFFGTISAQTVLNRFPLALKKSSSYFQIINAENAKNEYFAFITDKEKNTVLKYNSALFFTDSISIPRPERKLDFMAGATFNADGNPNLYWSSTNYEQIQYTTFDFKTHTTSSLLYENDFSKEKIIDVFVAANSFNIVTVTSENKLKFTNFSNSGKSEHLISIDPATNPTSELAESNVISAVLEFGITKVETNFFTALFVGVAKVKRYLKNENQYVLGIDLKTATALLTIDLHDFSTQKEVFPYDKLNEYSGSNSFLHQDVLYQLSANEAALSLYGTDLKTKEIVEMYKADAKNEISFKNSPLLLQRENAKTKELKNTDKFLSKMDFDNVGLSIYRTPNYNLFTIGGVREVASGGGIALAIGVGFAGVMSGSDLLFAPDLMSNNFQSIFFESFFDADFKHSNAAFRPLYIDALNLFTSENRIEVQNVVPYQNYVILNYYDSKTKEFVMRKFEDGTE